MRVRTKDTETQGGPHIIRIPKAVQKDITERWFHLYKWISPDEVKLSIERDFLKTLKFIWIPLWIISIILGFLTIVWFFVSIFIGIFFMFLYLLFLSIHRSRLLTKSAFVVMTDSSISLWGKIHKLSEIWKLKADIDEVSQTFEEDLFWESGLETSKKTLTEGIMEQLFGWYKKLFSFADNTNIWRGKDSAQFLLLIIALYTAYIGIMAMVYFVGVLWLLLFGKLIRWLNTMYLLKKWHTVIKINDLFGDLDISSENIKEHKKNLEGLLKEAHDNNWKDGLLLAINDGIMNINDDAQNAILSVLNLRNTIESSKYKDMFSFDVYNKWIKKQILKPLEQIKELLEKNLEILQNTQKEITRQLETTQKEEFVSNLKLQLKRLKMQERDIEKFIPMLVESIHKLQ